MRGVDLAIYADALAGEAASLAARAERARSRLRQVAIERRARAGLTPVAAERLEGLGLLGAVDEAATRRELRELGVVAAAEQDARAGVPERLQTRPGHPRPLRRRLHRPVGGAAVGRSPFADEHRRLVAR